MNDWKKFNGISLHEKEDFYSHLNMEDITNEDYSHARRVCKGFKIKKIEKYHDLICKQYIIVSRYIWELSKYVQGLPAHFITASR